MKRKFLFLLLAISIAGCFGSPAKIAMISDDDLKYVATMELCTAYGDKLFRTDRVKNELIARLDLYRTALGDITVVFPDKSGKKLVINKEKPPPAPWEWELIEKGEIKKGMSQCGLLASKGMPTNIVKSRSGVNEWFYEGFFSYLSVKIIKGKIKSWEE
jgi:hypothetical protein